MNELTVLFFMLSIGLFLVRYFLKEADKVNWLTFFTSMIGICCVLSDESLIGDDMIFMLVPMIFVVMMCGVTVITHKS